MQKSRIGIIATTIVALSAMTASAVTKWNVNSDGNWTNAANWDAGLPDATDVTSSTKPYTIRVDSTADALKFWNGNDSEVSSLDIQTNGNLSVVQDVNINEFSNATYKYAGLQLNDGSLSADNLNVAARPTSHGEGSLVMNSGSIDLSDSFNIGKSLNGWEAHGVATMFDGSFDVGNNFHVGGAVNERGTGVLNVHGGTFSATNGFVYVGGYENPASYTNRGSGTINVYGGAVNLGGNVVNISRAGSSDGTINMYGGLLTASANVQMDSDTDIGGRAEINLYGGEFLAEAGLDINHDSGIHVAGGILTWAGTDGIAEITNQVNLGRITWANGLTNMLTESWDASFTNTVTTDYGYWTNTQTSALFVDYDDVSAGDATVWAYNLTPTPGLPEDTDGPTTNKFTNNGGDQLWTTAANWDIGTAPTGLDRVEFSWDGNPSTLVVASEVEALDLLTGHNNTASVAVVSGGSLTVGNDVEIASSGSTGVGKLIVDGGDVAIGNDVYFGRWGTSRHGIGELNSGSITVDGLTHIGGGNAGATGMLTIAEGTYTGESDFFEVGRTGNGTLNMNGGLLKLETDGAAWKPLKVGTETGDGTINLNGGTIHTHKVEVEFEDTDAGTGTINLNGGLLRIEAGFAAGLRVEDDGQVVFGKGVLQWKADRIDNFTALVDGGFIDWADGQTNMLTESWDASWTNGADILYADYDDANPGYTTVWAYTPPVPTDPPVMLIAAGAGSSVDVTATNLNAGASYDLMGSDSLTATNWSSAGTCSGVVEKTWNVPASGPARFFRVEEQ
ncbi:hypothetical protein PDESU_03418 [Pontiella desulfatans]|uniref:Uncharacterized protein n=1 Tax=Pontiella desulfatans TaxID=2750659 RepID=A0A6C2U462_PONDE|nr:hypothetical protein [Pontiella desulfatans]VGO14848.1 hypothetical protein PDESU_03418 [Pontiella desulfatans]